MDVAETHYAKSGDRHIGYQVLGNGPIDLLALNTGCNVWIDRDDEPHWSRFDRRLASFSRLIRFDPIGSGLSDPLAGGSAPTIEGWVQDALAVLDAVGAVRAALFGVSVGGLAAMLLSATCQERVSALVLMHCHARMARDVDYPWGWPQHILDRFNDAVTDPTYVGDAADLLIPFCFLLWWATADTSKVDAPYAIGIRTTGHNGGDTRFDITNKGLEFAPANIDDCPAVFEFDPATLVLSAYNRVNAGTVRGDRRLATHFRSLFVSV